MKLEIHKQPITRDGGLTGKVIGYRKYVYVEDLRALLEKKLDEFIESNPCECDGWDTPPHGGNKEHTPYYRLKKLKRELLASLEPSFSANATKKNVHEEKRGEGK